MDRKVETSLFSTILYLFFLDEATAISIELDIFFSQLIDSKVFLYFIGSVDRLQKLNHIYYFLKKWNKRNSVVEALEYN